MISKLSSRIDRLEGGHHHTSSQSSELHHHTNNMSSNNNSNESNHGSQQANDDGEDGVLDPVSIGDQMLLNASELANGGFLHGDLAAVRMGLQEADVCPPSLLPSFLFSIEKQYIYICIGVI